ncbi:MAG: nitroreductase [Rhodopirellula sp.]|nr:nitroreductase [Rhodopirellula sp.]
MVGGEGITDVIRRRRTVKPKEFSDQTISQEIIDEILENANWAPTHGFTEPWRFSVFTGDARYELAEFLAATYKAVTTEDTYRQNKYEGMKRNATLAPVVIVIGMKRQPSGKISELDEIQAVACAVQNMHLTATAHGIGGFWSSNAAATSDQMRDYIGLSGDDRALGLFYLGYPSKEWPVGKRQPVSDKVRWVESKSREQR